MSSAGNTAENVGGNPKNDPDVETVEQEGEVQVEQKPDNVVVARHEAVNEGNNNCGNQVARADTANLPQSGRLQNQDVRQLEYDMHVEWLAWHYDNPASRSWNGRRIDIWERLLQYDERIQNGEQLNILDQYLFDEYERCIYRSRRSD